MAFVIRYAFLWLAAKMGTTLLGKASGSTSIHPALRWGATAGLALVPVVSASATRRKRVR